MFKIYPRVIVNTKSSTPLSVAILYQAEGNIAPIAITSLGLDLTDLIRQGATYEDIIIDAETFIKENLQKVAEKVAIAEEISIKDISVVDSLLESDSAILFTLYSVALLVYVNNTKHLSDKLSSSFEELYKYVSEVVGKEVADKILEGGSK